MPAFRMSDSSASATPGYWILTATSRPSMQLRAVDLADRGGGERLGLELGEVLVDRLARTPPRAPSRPCSHGIGGAEVRSFASSSW